MKQMNLFCHTTIEVVVVVEVSSDAHFDFLYLLTGYICQKLLELRSIKNLDVIRESETSLPHCSIVGCI